MNTLKKIVALFAVCVLCTACAPDEDRTTDNPRTDNIQADSTKANFDPSKPVALITNYEDIESGITIQRANGTPDGSEALLYPGDTITGKVDDVNVKCAPYAEFQIKNGAGAIAYNPPSDLGKIARNAIEYASSFWNNVETVSMGASRGSEEDLNLKPQPGFDVTLLTNQSVCFAWDGSAKNFVITNEAGEKVFEKAIGGAKKIDVVPSEANLKAGQKYSWSVNGNDQFKFSILDAQTEKEILDGLAEIDAEKLSADERALKKAAYVQLVSDIYPDKVDLYWLSAQWLSEISPTDKKLKDDRFVLMKKCSQHLDDEM